MLSYNSVAIMFILMLGTSSVKAQEAKVIDWSLWERYRKQVIHPAGAIKSEDLERARLNAQRYEWARTYIQRLCADADSAAKQINAAWLEQYIERTTPGCVGPCPACRAQGLPWHPNGQWSWTPSAPNQLTCSVCKTVFPNDSFPEEIVVQSTWDPDQKFSFVGGDTFRCFGYTHARPSLTGIIRARKVGYATSRAYTLALAYALTGDIRYARAAKAVLLRFAEVLPKYLVRAGYGYGEYADCDPHVAAAHIDDLPTDELVYPPNRPDRRLYAGYWAASRIGSSGMDGSWVRAVATTYDLTCMAVDNGTPLYSEEERLRIERDVLLEGAYLAACDPAINNKSVGNRCGAAMVGLVVGQPILVHFGLEGFIRTVEEWFLPDGGTSESPAYAMMTMNGVEDFGLMFRDYADPEGFASPEGNRYEHFNAYRDTRYGDCWQSLLWTLQGDLRHPPSADSYRTTSIGASHAELIAVAYPTDEHIAFLRELAGPALAGGSPQQAILYREPGLETQEVAPFVLPEVVFPFLAQGYLRTGAMGRDSLALLNASDWGGHHHLDSLDLYYWQAGRELLSDLGYLWDHPDAYQTRRTWAHNLVLLDGMDQRTQGRGGSFHLFSVTPTAKVMEASSTAYTTAEVYRRTCVLIDHGEAGSYLVDLFRVQGGHERQYVFHGPHNQWRLEGLELEQSQQTARLVPFAVRFHLGDLGEIFVDDVEVRPVLADGSEGDNLAPNPSLAEGKVDQPPPGWGMYLGDGSAEYKVATPGRTDGTCAHFRARKPSDEGKMNAALLIGESNGYQGQNALRGVMGGNYRVRFWMRGTAPKVTVGIVTWPHDATSAEDRKHTNFLTVTPTDEWVKYEGEIALPSGDLPLQNLREASGNQPWHITWTFEDDYEFAAFSPGHRGERVLVGDGWGQRDHRNTDRGATLPYLVRVSDGPQLDTFVTVFGGAPAGTLPVQGVRLLDLPEGTPADVVAVEVDTTRGADILVSALTPTTLTVRTSLGELTMSGCVAIVVGEQTTPLSATLVGGTNLRIGELALTASVPAYRGSVVAIGSAPGESWFELDAELPAECVGQTLFIQDGALRRAYPLRHLQGHRAYTKRKSVGFEARLGETWEVPVTISFSFAKQER
ncbi:MAG: heparinase II/III domain-containing protein [Candidatus Zipacnadales bacterium]